MKPPFVQWKDRKTGKTAVKQKEVANREEALQLVQQALADEKTRWIYVELVDLEKGFR